MTQPTKAPRQAKDTHAQRTKALSSSVQRLRGWVGSDPSRRSELGDALVELTGHRLRGYEFAAAAQDAQDSVRQAAQLLTANGPVGAYTEAVDAARYVSAVVQLASVQAGLGLPEAAARTVASLDDLHEQLVALRMELPLAPEIIVRALVCIARGALAAGDATAANAGADDAVRHLAAAGPQDDPDTAYLALEVDRLLADARWAADRPADALGHLHRARDRWADVVAGRLDAPAGLSPSLVDRLAAPAFALHRDLADRLMATGEVDLALSTRRALVDLLRRLSSRTGSPTGRQLSLALADLAADLLAVDRAEEADASSAESLALLGPSTDLGWSGAVRARALLRTGRGSEAVRLIQSRPLPAEPQPVTGLLQQVLGEAQRAAGDADAATASERAADEIVAQLGLDGHDRLVDRVRGVVSRGRAPVTWSAPDPTVWDRLVPGAAPDPAATETPATEDTPAWLAAERADARRREDERAAQARAETEQREAERQQAVRRDAEQQERARARAVQEQQAEEARRAAAEEAERQEVKRRREERLEGYRLESERREAEQARVKAEPELGVTDELAAATQAWQEARAGADRRTTRAAAERLAELLRPRAQQDPSEHGPLLQQTLAELAGLRMRGGDLLGARSASREAKELARTLRR